MRRGAFVILVVVSVSVVWSAPTASAPAAAVGPTTVYLPNVTKMLGGPDGWQTPFIVQNVGAVATAITMSFYSFDDGSLVRTRSVASLAPGTSIFHDPNSDEQLAPGGQFSVVVQSSSSPVVAVVNEHQGVRDPARQEALSYRGLSEGAVNVYAPYFANQVAGWLTTLIVQAVTGTTNVTLNFRSYDGTRTATLTRTIEPGRAKFVDPRFESALVPGIEYSVSLTATRPIGVVVNAHNDAPSTPAPMGFSYNGTPASSSPATFVPYAARNTDGIGRYTRLFVQNMGVASATPRLLFRRFGSTAPITVTGPSALAPGAAWALDLRSTTQLSDGEYAALTQDGQFAVVAAALAPTSASGYSGHIGSYRTFYLPNVTRTLGGANGWTTPIVLQSHSDLVTNARLSWFRFSDGVKVASQMVFGLSFGASVRVDPRAVPGLADDTQYAVLVEAPAGGISALVTELNFGGGDGAMTYEGFVTPRDLIVSGCTPTTAPAGSTFACRFGVLPAGATPVSVSVTEPNASPITSTFTTPVSSDGAFWLWLYWPTQGAHRATVTAGGATATADFTVTAATFSVRVTESRNGRASVQTKETSACVLQALDPSGAVDATVGTRTEVTDALGLATFSYAPVTSPAGTWTHVVRCTSGTETLSDRRAFTVP